MSTREVWYPASASGPEHERPSLVTAEERELRRLLAEVVAGWDADRHWNALRCGAPLLEAVSAARRAVEGAPEHTSSSAPQLPTRLSAADLDAWREAARMGEAQIEYLARCASSLRDTIRRLVAAYDATDTIATFDQEQALAAAVDNARDI